MTLSEVLLCLPTKNLIFVCLYSVCKQWFSRKQKVLTLGLPAVAPSSKVGQALPEDIFAAPATSSLGLGDNFRVNVGVPGQNNGLQASFGQHQGLGQQQLPSSSPHKASLGGSQQGLGAFASSAPSTEVNT